MENVKLALLQAYINDSTSIDLKILNSNLQNINGLEKIPIDENIGLPYIIVYKKRGILITKDGNAKWVNSIGKNIFNVEETKMGYINYENGYEDENNKYWVMSNNYIKCKSDTNYVLSYESDNNYFQGIICFYDENKNFIKGSNLYGHNISQLVEVSPSNAKFVKIVYSVKVNEVEVNRYNIQLEEGMKRTEYESYFDMDNF